MRMNPPDPGRNKLKSAGFSDDMIQSVFMTYNHGFPENVVDYMVALRAHGMPDEQIMIIINTATGAMGIFDVRRFFREIAPHFRRFGFTKKRIEDDIRAFDEEMQEYGRALIGVRKVDELCQHPNIVFGDLNHRINTLYMIGMCTTDDGEFYRAGVEFIEWARRGKTPDDTTRTILQKCVGPDGVNMKRLLRLTEKDGDLLSLGRSMVSHQDSKEIKTIIAMRNAQYARAVFDFFDQNKGEIRKIARNYTDIKFMAELYELCVGWPGWTCAIARKNVDVPGHFVTPREGVEYVMKSITNGLPDDVQDMMINIAVRQFVKIVPATEYEPWWAHVARLTEYSQQRR